MKCERSNAKTWYLELLFMKILLVLLQLSCVVQCSNTVLLAALQLCAVKTNLKIMQRMTVGRGLLILQYCNVVLVSAAGILQLFTQSQPDVDKTTLSSLPCLLPCDFFFLFLLYLKFLKNT